MQKLIRWLKSVLSEKDGTGSSSRIAMLIIVAGVVVALLVCVISKHELPSGETLRGLAEIIAAAATLYGANAYKNVQTDKGSSAAAAADQTQQP